MKKQLLFLSFLMLLNLGTQAQYGHRVYNVDTTSNEQFNDGLITDAILSGGAPVYAGGGFSISQTTTGAPYVRSRFTTVNFSGTQLSGTRYFVFSGGSELQNRVNGVAENGTSGYVLSGTAFSSSTSGNVMIMGVNTAGVPSSVRSIDMNAFDESFCTRRSNNNTTRFYTCGSSTPTALTSSQVFLMKHNASASTIDWVRRFNLPCGNVNAFAEAVSVVDDAASGSVVIVGNFRLPASGCQQAFIAKFSSAGVLSWLRILSSQSMTNIELQSIRPTNTNQEYIITGSAISTALPGRKQVLLMRVGTSGANPVTVFSRLIYSNGPTPNFPVQNQTGFDVVTRRDSLNVISYYVTGVTQLTSGKTDGFLLRTNNVGLPVFMREYFGSGDEALFAIDMVESTARKGLASFGTFDANNTSTFIRKKSWLAKTYFNLVAGCNEFVDSPLVSSPAIIYNVFSPVIQTTFTNTALTVQTGTTTGQSICWNITLAAGSNARLQIPSESAVDGAVNNVDLVVYPNPVIGDELNLSLTASLSEEASITIMDVTGKVFLLDRIELNEGENHSMLQVNDLPSGIYLLNIVTESNHRQSIRFVKK